MVLLKLKAREEQGKEKNKVHLVTCNHHKVMCDSTMKSANQDLTPSAARAPQKVNGVAREAALGYTDLITFVQDRAGHDWRYAIDATKMNEKLNWKPAETFETGIRKTVAWYLNGLNKENG